MPTEIHFIDVGQGNMTLIKLDDGKIMLYDCNITSDNEESVIRYLVNQIGWDTNIDIFVNSHRDADHMRGIKKIHNFFPVQEVWDSGVAGSTTDSTEYLEYMNIRRTVGYRELEHLKFFSYGKTKLRIMNSKNDNFPDNPNAQSIVIKVQHLDINNKDLASALLTGDTDASTWRYSIEGNYKDTDLKTNILLASHHGSISFFDDPKDKEHYYLNHLYKISPEMTIISVGRNCHGHPDDKAIEFYNKHTTGSKQGNILYTTQDQGNIKLTLKDEGGWSLTPNQ